MKTYIIKVGGSNLSLSEDILFDFNQAERIKNILLPFIQNGDKFVLITGGGYTSRKYQNLFNEKGYPDYDVHYIGTAICNLNAIMLRAVFGDLAESEVIAFNDFENLENINFNKPVLLAGAAKPGPSSDWDSAMLAKELNGNVVISLKNINGVYSSDPKKDPNAKKIDTLTWDEYLNIIENKSSHKPGDNLPVDPVASKFSKENNIQFYILDGRNLDELVKVLNGEKFDGSIIKI